MLQEKRYLQGIMDGDTDGPFIAPNAYFNAENVRYGTTDFGGVGAMESILSNKALVNSALQPGVNLVIGAVSDEPTRRIFFFITNSLGYNGIWCYDLAANTFTAVLLEKIPSAGPPTIALIGGFGWNTNMVIHSARVVNGLLYWVDNVAPRKVNIEAGLKLNSPSYVTTAVAYPQPLKNSEITIIKPPPVFAAAFQKNYDNTFANNFIANNSFSFAFQYVWYDNEVTVTGSYSGATRLNKTSDNFNRIVVTMNPGEVLPATIRMVQLVARIGNNAFIIKTWDKAIPSEATEIANQNAPSQVVLTFNFYNNITGAALAQANILKPFDSVPIQSQALEVVKDRLFLGNNTAGYDTPITTSLSFNLGSTPISIGSALNKNLISFETNYLTGAPFYSSWLVYLTEVSPIGYYAVQSTEQFSNTPLPQPPPPVAPTTVAFSGLIFRGATYNDVMANLPKPGILPYMFYTAINTINVLYITGITLPIYDTFLPQSFYQIGIAFYDNAMRKCGVVTNNSLRVSIPARNYAFDTAYTTINWTLTNANAVNEIASWAFYYSIVRTLNLRTRFFISAFDKAAKYATKDANGVYTFTSTAFVTNAAGIGLDTTALAQAGLGYVFSQGDTCILIDNSNNMYQLPVIGQYGNYVILKAQNIGELSNKKFVYQIYTPYQSSDQEPFYEVGNMYMVNNPGDPALRSYSTTSGALIPDAYAIARNYSADTYLAEAMSPNDLFYNRWDNDGGKVNIVTKLGQQLKKQSVMFSNTFIPGTAQNGLSTFEALNEKFVGQECGPLRKLILTSKVQDEGNVMLAICEQETNSLYLGETRLMDQTGTTQFVAQSTAVIGTINVLKGSFGTINPESVVEFRGNVYWLDLYNGKYIQYSSNGLFPISNYKMTRYWKLFSNQFLKMSLSDFTALGSRPFVFSTVDPHHEELLVSVPKMLAVPPGGYLPDYPSIINPFDIYDGQAKAWVYKINTEPNHWQGAYTFIPECYAVVNNLLFSFKNGALWVHNQLGSFCNFYGVQSKARLMLAFNAEPSKTKVLNNIAIVANLTPSFTYIRTDYPYVQGTDLMDFDYEVKEGVYYCQVYNDKLTPSPSGLLANALFVGDKMRSTNFKILLEYNINGPTALELQFVQAGYTFSRGHTI